MFQQLALFDPSPAVIVAPQPVEYVVAGHDLTAEQLNSYNHIIVMLSGGKDSVASVLKLFAAGAPHERIELWHHEIDGREGSRLMDWPVTPAYCRAFAAAFNLPICFSWKVGGFEGEMSRDDAPTAPTVFETPDGSLGTVGGNGPRNTRLRFPQQSADLTTRWCSAYLKIMVADAALRNQERFKHTRTLVVTGERAAESPCRARYAPFETHRADARASAKTQRHINHWRPIHGWSDEQVWDALRRWRINPHPCYHLGWGRCSCAGCIFGSADQWASLREVNPAQFATIAAYERQFGVTISRSRIALNDLADRGAPFAAITDERIAAALSDTFEQPIILPEGTAWVLPAGAFGDTTGPA